MESINSRIPIKSKQAGSSDKHCAICKKHGGAHKLHNTHDCHKYNSDSTPTNRNGGAGSTLKNTHVDNNHLNQIEHKGANYVRLVCKEVKKLFCKHSSKHKKCCANDSESDSDSDYSS